MTERDARSPQSPLRGSAGREPSRAGVASRLDLAALIAGPDNGGLRLVSGDGTVTWTGMRMAIAETGLPTVRVGAVAILMSPPPTASWQQDALIRRVSDKGYSVLALPETALLTESALRLAARLGPQPGGQPQGALRQERRLRQGENRVPLVGHAADQCVLLPRGRRRRGHQNGHGPDADRRQTGLRDRHPHAGPRHSPVTAHQPKPAVVGTGDQSGQVEAGRHPGP